MKERGGTEPEERMHQRGHGKLEPCEYQELEEHIFRNPHFREVFPILADAGIDTADFMDEFRSELVPLLDRHRTDNTVLKEECYSYILPAISIYRVLKKHVGEPLKSFRHMWIAGAKAGAAFLREKAKDRSFLEGWIRQVTPKDCDAGAFLFEIDHLYSNETEYHVLRCPYVEMCTRYGCPEIIPVFCDSDDVSFGSIHPRLVWGRTQTIGHGAPYCDFKYTLLSETP